ALQHVGPVQAGEPGRHEYLVSPGTGSARSWTATTSFPPAPVNVTALIADLHPMCRRYRTLPGHDHGDLVVGGAPSPKPPCPPAASPRPHFLRFPHVQTRQSTHRSVSKQ